MRNTSSPAVASCCLRKCILYHSKQASHLNRHEDVAVTYMIVIACSTKTMIDQWRFGFGKLFFGIPAKEIDSIMTFDMNDVDEA